MRKLLHGLIDFRERLAPSYQATFAQLAMGQQPDVLFVGCSDSRVVPNLFASTEPGDLFVLRNVGNLVAPCDAHGDEANTFEHSEAAAIEYAVEILGVVDIVVCGHSECGATLALLDEKRPLSPNLKSWLRHGKASVERLKGGEQLDPTLPLHNQLSQINVLQQIEHLRSYPVIQKALAAKRLRLHAWYFNIGSIEVETYDAVAEKFLPIDRKMAGQLLASMGDAGLDQQRESMVPWQMAKSDGQPAGKSYGAHCCQSQQDKGL